MPKLYPASLVALLATVTLPTGAAASSPPAPSRYPVPTVTFQAAPAEFRGDSATVRVRAVIPKGWHIQSNAPFDDFLIPTEVRVAKGGGEGLRFGNPVFPKAIEKDFPALGGKVALFEDTIEVRVPVYRKGAQKDKPATARAIAAAAVTLRYQACNDSQCLPPREVAARYMP